MRKTVLIAAILTFTSAVAIAQTPSQQGPANPAVKGVHDNNSAMPVAGANSFTKGEAVKQIQAKVTPM